MDEFKSGLGELEEFAIARRPVFSRLQCRAFHLPNSDHLACVRFGELAPADASAAAADPGQVFADIFLPLSHFPDTSSGITPSLQFNGLNHAS